MLKWHFPSKKKKKRERPFLNKHRSNIKSSPQHTSRTKLLSFKGVHRLWHWNYIRILFSYFSPITTATHHYLWLTRGPRWLGGLSKRNGWTDRGTITLTTQPDRAPPPPGSHLHRSSRVFSPSPLSFGHRLVLQVYSSLQEIYDTMVHLLHISVHYIIFTFFSSFFLKSRL